MTKATLINLEILKWARESLNLSLEDVAKKVNKDIETVASWEDGKDFPTYVQLEYLAYKVYKRPIAVFYFSELPNEDKIQKAFRTLPDSEYNAINHNVIKIFREARVKQMKLKELCDEKNPSDFHLLKRYKLMSNHSIEKIAHDLRDMIGIALSEQKSFQNADKALKSWRTSLEKLGIFVFKDAFKEKNISGFCLFDDEFPIIYINNSMPKTRQIFTLFHELAHLLFNTGGIDKLDDSYILNLSEEEKMIETFCNLFAAEFLVPDDDFNKILVKYDYSEDSISNIAKLYCVSREVISRKLLDRGYISKDKYMELSKKWIEQAIKTKKDQSGGGNYYATKITYLGDNYLNIAFGNYYRERISVYQLADYIDTSVSNLPKLESTFIGGKR
jgi:Zn-dependent peptidase ImmA (M78 family)/transcriptional regulator with XRE-family HTH domain